jgi:type II secretory pathway component PulF
MDDRAPTTNSALTPAHAEALIERAAQIAAAGMPLAAGLRAAAQEADSRGLARSLRQMAAEIERGRSLDDLLASSRKLPAPLAGLIRAAQRTGHLGAVLAEWIENRRAARQRWRSIEVALAYPIFTLILALFVFLIFAMAVVRPFEEIVSDFQLQLPFNATALFYVCRVGPEMLLVVLGLSLVILAGLRVIGGRTGWSWLVTNLPFIGKAWHWSGVAEMLRNLSLLVDHRVPLPEALRLTASGISDAYVASLCMPLVQRIEQGSPLWAALVQTRSLPLSIVPLVHWGELNDALPEALRTAAEMLEGRLRVRSGVLIQILPPFIFVIVGVMIGSLMAMILTTMVRLIQELT